MLEIGEAEAAWYLNAGGMQMLGRSADVVRHIPNPIPNPIPSPIPIPSPPYLRLQVRTEAQLAQTEASCRALSPQPQP